MPKKYFLFSLPTEAIKLLFSGIKKLAYMPSNGADPNNHKWETQWVDACHNHNVEFVNINNATDNIAKEAEKLLSCGSLLICGGNSFTLLDNLRKTGMDKEIQKFSQRPETKIAGFSAGAIVLYKDINLALVGDENKPGLQDLTGLDHVKTEIFPHYSPDQEEVVTKYEQQNNRKVVRLTNEQYIVTN